MSVNNNQNFQTKERVARFTASGSWVAPAGVYSVKALAVGGGGGGGASRSNSSTYCYAGGGGGGGGVIDERFPIVPGTTYAVTIGTGGAAANGSSAGANGTNTTFGSLFTAPGGQGGVSYLINNQFIPTSNPGGSMGGWSVASSGSLVGSGHGNGAATPILMAAVSSALSVGDAATATSFTFYNGITNLTVPVAFIYETSTPFDSIHGAIYNASRTATTRYLGVKRNDNPFVPAATSWIPGYAWKGLGAGGASVLTYGVCAAPAVSNIIYLEPSAGFVPVIATQNLSSNTTVISGTSGQDNTGAGGGGSVGGGTSNTIASGGTGGSGYVEIVWQE